MTARPWCIGHRGARDEAPENTLSALRRALDRGADGIEFDVQLSADGVPVLFHDRILRKAGCGRRVSDLKAAELNLLDWGYWFHPDFTGEPLTTLEAALDLLPRCPHMLVEIKTHPRDHENGHARRLAEAVVRMIDRPARTPFHERIRVLSFDGLVLKLAHDLAPHLQYVRNLPEANPAAALRDTRHLTAVDVKISKLDAPLTQRIRRKGLGLFTYTCNGPNQVKKALRLGVDAIISDRPGWLGETLDLLKETGY